MTESSMLLKEYRLRRGYTQRRLSSESGINISTLKGWERYGFANSYRPSVDRVATILGIPEKMVEEAIRKTKSREKRAPGKKTLCWKCQRAAGKKMCAWAALGEPIHGWKAEPRTICNGGEGQIVQSYCVEECPMFLPDQKEA